MKRIASVGVLMALASAVSTAQAQLVMQMGNNWNFTLSGNVNGFYVEQWGPLTQAAIGGSAVGNAGTTANVRTGLLPADINFAAKGHEDGLDIGVFFGFYPQIQNGGPLGNNHDQFGAQIDMRQAYLTVGNSSWGQIEVGRDLGLFNRENILTDATLFGVGAIGSNLGSGGTTLGRIGFGYIYPNFNAQITYTTPAGHPLSWSIGVFQPSEIGSSSAAELASTAGGSAGAYPYTPLPRIESELTWTDNLSQATSGMAADKLLLWVNGEWQQARNAPSGTPSADTILTINAGGLGGGGKLDVGDFSLVGSGYWGRGIGTTLQFGPISVDANGQDRTSYGYIGQITWKFSSKWSLTGSYGESFIGGTNFDQTFDPGYPTLLKYNSEADGLLIYQWTKSVKYVIEYGYDTAANVSGGKDISNSIATGLMLFF